VEHSSVAFTLENYVHRRPEDRHAAVAKLDTYVRSAR
jgi:hypothetical protein